MRGFFNILFALCSSLVAATSPNILFIASDDLRVELGCYGQDWVQTPHLDKLARTSTRFSRAYCQVALCNPSRASLLTGLYPDTLGVIDLPTHFRLTHPEIVTLPEYFKQQGYFTKNIGKVFHNWHQDDLNGDPQSWSAPAEMHYNAHINDVVTPKTLLDGQEDNTVSSLLNKRAEKYDVPDDAYWDGIIAGKAVRALKILKQKDRPFFLAVGFWKPHLPFNAPKKYWDLYQNNPELAPYLQPKYPRWPELAPDLAKHPGRELMRSFNEELDSEQVALLRQGYYAAISYLDAQVGKVLEALEALGLEENTIVVFWSDHGFHLGERGLWCKNSCYELDTQVPLMIRTPGQERGQVSDSFAELIDLYPTLVELCGLPAVEPLPGQPMQGKSLVPVLQDPFATVRQAALSQILRPAYSEKADRTAMGYSLRTQDFRYTQWRSWTSDMRNPSNEHILGEELYDLRKDPEEVNNLAGMAKYEQKKNRLRNRLAERLADIPGNYQ